MLSEFLKEAPYVELNRERWKTGKSGEYGNQGRALPNGRTLMTILDNITLYKASLDWNISLLCYTVDWIFTNVY